METLKQIGLVLFMQVLSLVLELIDTGTLKPSVKKRLAVEFIVLLVYVSGLTVFNGLISEELLTLIGTVYIGVVCASLFKFLNGKKESVTDSNQDKDSNV